MSQEKLEEKISENINSTTQFDKWDALTPENEDYMMYSPQPVGYNTTESNVI